MLLEGVRDRRNQRLLLIVGVLLVLVTLGLREIANRPVSYEDFSPGSSTGTVTVVIEEGATGEEIARELDDLGVIASWRLFFNLAVSDERANRIAPGSYQLDLAIPAEEALEQLLDLDRVTGLISLRDGVRLNEAAELLRSLGYENVNSVLKNTTPPEGFEGGDLEGFLYPARYSFPPNTPVEEVVRAMIRRFEAAVVDLDFTNTIPEFSRREVITIASMVEAEGTPDVFGKVARVIFNRLEIGMPLQMDSTIHFIQRSRGRISLSLQETEVKNPYNTYQYRGLPPGPIGSPTRSAILASLDPTPGDWLYFITVAPKDTRFTSSYEQFLEWKRLYRANYEKGLFDND